MIKNITVRIPKLVVNINSEQRDTLQVVGLLLFCLILSFATSCVTPNNNSGNSSNTNLQDLKASNSPNKLIIESQDSRVEALENSDLKVTRRRKINVDYQLLSSFPRGDQVVNVFPETSSAANVNFNLFDDAQFTGIIEQFQKIDDYDTWNGNLKETEGTFTIVKKDNDILINIRVQDGRGFRIINTSDSIELQQLDTTKIKEEAAPILPDLQELTSSDKTIEAFAQEDGSQLDVAVFYTAAARDAAAVGATPNAIEKMIVDNVSFTNKVFKDSGVLTTLNLKAKMLVNYDKDKDEATSIKTILDDLTGKTDGQMDDVHSLRKQNVADIVMLVAKNKKAGIAHGMTEKTFKEEFEASAFGVVAWDQIVTATQQYAFEHELGHILGNSHARGDKDSISGLEATQGVFPYSWGNRFKCGSNEVPFITIMAYPPGGRIPRFSNPEKTFATCPTGVPEGQLNASDEAKTINNTKKLVANFRPRIQ